MYALSADELLTFCTAETQRWQEWFNANPQTLDLPIDIAQAKSVRELVLHIVAATAYTSCWVHSSLCRTYAGGSQVGTVR